MTSTRQALRQLVSEGQGDYFSSTTTSIGAAAGANLICTAIQDIPEGRDDDGIANWFIVRRTPYEVRRLKASSAYTAATGTCVPQINFSTQIASGETFELHRGDPAEKNTAINRAASALFPSLYLPVRDETLIVDNLILNPNFATFTTTFTNWTNIGTPTLAQEATRVWHGATSADITASGAVEGIEQNLFTRVNYKEVVGKTLHIRAAIFDSTADQARIRVTFDGTTYTNGPWHAGDAEWEGFNTQYIDVTIPADATEMTVSCEVNDGAQAYFGFVIAWIDHIYRYAMPTSIVGGEPTRVSVQSDLNEPQGVYTKMGMGNAWPQSGAILRVEGMGVLTQPASDTATMEVDEPFVNLLVEYATWWLERTAARQSGTQSRERLLEDQVASQQEVNRLLGTSGQHHYTMPVSRRYGWTTEKDGSTNYLVLTERR